MKSTLYTSCRQLSFLGLLFMALEGCSVDLIPQDRIAEEKVWADPNSAELYVSGIYAEFKKFQFGQFPNLGYDNAMDALADGMKFTSNTAGNGTVNILVSNSNQFSSASVGLNYWASGYERIRRINEMINGINTKSSLSDAQKQVYEAEGRFVRAYAYFWLVKIHGSVILFKSMDQYTEKDHERSSEEAVYDFILEDLQYAVDHLPLNNLAGRATQGAAYTLMARVGLYAGSIAKYDLKQFNQDPLTGISQARSAEYFKKSADAAQKVIDMANGGLYALDDNFASIFTNKTTKEAIFRVDFAAPDVTHQYDLGYAPPRDAPGNTLVYGVPTAELVNEFEMADGSKFSWQNAAQAAAPYTNREPRFYATILYNGATWKGRTLNTSTTDAIEGFTTFGASGDPKRTVTGYYVRKMLDPTNTTFVQNKSTQSWIEMRYAEVLLIMAEAKAQLGDFATATTYINQLRQKRGLNALSLANNNQAMAAVEHERKVELAFEGHRFWDLRRWRKAHLLLDNVKFTGHKISPNATGLTYEVVSADATNRSFSTKLYYLPIPENEVQLNGALTQIKGW
ncbi:RagB/SusD family nutrient uptake outer membrane protein [Sphingobacterium sp. UGAL515B_05]|uniref:RagB/SusD family nutrient uptake outer membrane protein n=1 Tax=Sphingobacterium sp. UGAL515B_05 TaxID=2986767 RepID=UPI002953F6BB|nr:RagB/SusD family nutrient uptake outer membrane protein [Sphingobacterium sp. UGAL515B_05]WON92688.1 RagB/SusD family nutrient uptake outer membrane protein [Sphingobacterium sp. UGAL515B_05]